MEEETKTCFRCKETKPVGDFYKDSRRNKKNPDVVVYRSWCKACWLTESKRHIKYRPERTKFYDTLRKAIRKGQIVKGTCILCGSTEVQAHHEDYTKPLQVMWLCRRHHEDLHHGRLELNLLQGETSKQ